VKLYKDRFAKLVGAKKQILERLPYLGLDIESVEDDSIRVEYSPNRPDFSTDYGIARALRGVMGIEVGLPGFETSPSGLMVRVDKRLSKVRPFIACTVARGLKLDDETVRQLISMQEDLHNGLGRHRRKVAIGFHDLDVIDAPIYYAAAEPNFSFAPLGEEKEMTLSRILSETETGRAYGGALSGARLYPILRDSKEVVLSFPPIINGKGTKVSSATENIFVDVTSTDEKAGTDVLAIIASALSDAGAALETVRVEYDGRLATTPDLSVSRMPLDPDLVRGVTGLSLTLREMKACIARSRLGVQGGRVLYPRYRVDLLHPVDIAEEVAIGYGIDRMAPAYPPSKQPGAFSSIGQSLERIATTMTSSGMMEVMSFELLDAESLYGKFGRSSSKMISVENPRSLEHSVLRDFLVPSLMSILSRNMKEEFPQRIFEVGRTYERTTEGVAESWHLCALIAHTNSGFSEAKMYLEACYHTLLGKRVNTASASHWAFADGRCASVSVAGERVGYAGEVKPSSLASFGINLPVSGFEVDLSHILRTAER
jgi:phenylalanyl-tRNA synthetase beta chain